MAEGSNKDNRPFDVIVFGATGYTGRLVAEYLDQTYRGDASVKWAMAGRSEEKLAAVRDEIGAPADTTLIVANADDPAALRNMSTKARCVISTVGPYTLYGMPLIEACAETGTDYVDLCGEPLFMVQTIEKVNEKAKETGARLVHSCGFDSIPSDLGVWCLQQAALSEHGAPAPRVRARVRKMQGTFSGGTAASAKATIGAVMADPSLKDKLVNPFALCEGEAGPEQPADDAPKQDDALGNVWLAPFIMATINSKNVHRSNKLLGHAYGKDFAYDEMIITGPGEEGKSMAEAIGKMGLGKDIDKKPGEGPTKEEREAGHYDFLIMGTYPDGREIRFGVTGDRDPGYGSTSKMLAESALCLVKDTVACPTGGVWTPAAAMGNALRSRLVEKAGMTFDRET